MGVALAQFEITGDFEVPTSVRPYRHRNANGSGFADTIGAISTDGNRPTASDCSAAGTRESGGVPRDISRLHSDHIGDSFRRRLRHPDAPSGADTDPWIDPFLTVSRRWRLWPRFGRLPPPVR